MLLEEVYLWIPFSKSSRGLTNITESHVLLQVYNQWQESIYIFTISFDGLRRIQEFLFGWPDYNIKILIKLYIIFKNRDVNIKGGS